MPVCTVCGKQYAQGKFCTACGGRLEDQQEMICCVCGRTFPSGKFCTSCGGKLVPKQQDFVQQEPMFCRRCNRTFPSGSFCTGCGGPLERYVPDNMNAPEKGNAFDEQKNNVLLRSNYRGNDETDIQQEVTVPYYLDMEQIADDVESDSGDFLEPMAEMPVSGSYDSTGQDSSDIYDSELEAFLKQYRSEKYGEADEEIIQPVEADVQQKAEPEALPTQGMVFEDISSNYSQQYDKPAEDNSVNQYDLYSEAVTLPKVAEESVAEEPVLQSVEDYIEETMAIAIQKEREVVEESVIEEPIYVEPQPEPMFEEPVFFDEPKAEEPAIEEPIYVEPQPEPLIEDPVFFDEPKAEESVIEEPIFVEPQPELMFEEPVFFDEPKAEEPVFEEPIFVEPQPEPLIEEPVFFDEPKAEEPAIEEPIFVEPQPEPMYEEPVFFDEPKAEESAIEEPIYAEPQPEPMYEEPVVQAPVFEEQPQNFAQQGDEFYNGQPEQVQQQPDFSAPPEQIYSEPVQQSYIAPAGSGDIDPMFGPAPNLSFTVYGQTPMGGQPFGGQQSQSQPMSKKELKAMKKAEKQRIKEEKRRLKMEKKK